MEFYWICWQGLPVPDSVREVGIVVVCTIDVRLQKARTLVSGVRLCQLKLCNRINVSHLSEHLEHHSQPDLLAMLF